ncbi:hypothetical protein LTR24_001024 [Lithohypha guttulata]|uniref:PNPLA domain-containing protein n=1 Tax=Lithohypha guttulata TaxID=1690604 RepID=A0ABR0KLY8_9EURO|nr:hypothetical protein LTR24_001024 [Lithohypha guttulata]
MQSRKDSTDGALRVLTLHGDGLQGLSIVSVIDELCSRIAEANGLTQYCRPSELFDVICGTGIGALIAVLLGRYCLDIGKCKEVYMDLAEFVEERQAARRGLRTGTIEEEDIHEFMEILIKEEGWSDVMEIPATVGRKKCQHVFMARSRNQHDGKSIIQLGSQAQIETLRRRSLPSSTKPARIPRVLAASVANGIRDWLPISNGFEARMPCVHVVVLTAVDELMASHQSNSSIGFLANIGPQRPESSNLDGISREPRSPARWVMDMTSPIRTVVMWPLKVTKRTLLASEPVLEADNESPVCGGRRAKSLSLIQWPIHGLIAPIDNTADSERGERQELVQEQVQQLLSETSEKRLFDFSSSLTASYETSDMADLKETRSNIKHIIGLMNDTGLFEEAARCFGQP